MTVFSSSFVSAYSLAFQEFVAIGSNISQRSLIGKETDADQDRNNRLLKLLEALDCGELTTKEIEALTYQVNSLLESQFVPTVNPIYSV